MHGAADTNAALTEWPQHAHGHAGPQGHPSSSGSGHDELGLAELTGSALAYALNAWPAVVETIPATKRHNMTKARRQSFMRAP
jgi:hypothetical protein